MISRVFFLFLFGVISAHLGYAQKLPKVKKPNMKVYINITSDTLIMKFHRPNQSIKLEGFILGYGSNYFSNQYIQWPENGKSFITDVEAEARYLIAVKPNENHKTCKEKNSSQKPLQVVIGSLTPTSVYLSWGILINPQIDWSALSKCPNDRFYTVRYKEKNKDWNFQLCPTTEAVVDNLKPNTMYEFGVKDNSDDEIWSKPQNHKTSPKGKENGNIENTYKIPKGTLQYATEDTKALIPVIIVKQGFQNISKPTAAPPPTVQSPVFREETKKPPLTTTRPTTPKPKPASKVTVSLPIPNTSEKTIAEDPKPALTSQAIVESFTSDSSTSTLEWVPATMVTHLYIQVTNIPTESSVIDEQSSSLAPIKTKVSESEVLSSTEEQHTKLEVTMAPNEQLPQSPIPAQTRPTVYLVPNEILSVHPKPVPSTEAPESEADSTLPESKIITTDAPHTYEPEKSTLASDDRIVVQKHTSTSKSHTTIAYRTRTTSFTTNTPTTSQRTQSTLASKRERVSPAQPKIPLPKKTQPTTVPVKTQKIPHKKDHSTVGPTPQTGKTEKDVSPKPHKTSQSPPTTAVPKPAQTAKMPIKPIIHIFSDPALPSVQSETQTTAPPIPKTTQSNKIPESKPAPKTTKKVSIHVISLQIFDKPDVPMVPNTTLTPQATTTQRPESPHTTPVPVQKVSQPITQKPKPSPRTRTKPAPTAAPKETTTLPKIPHVTAAATLATYRVQHSSSRPRTSLRPRTRPAQNGTTQGSSRPRPTGDFSWVPGTIPGGRVLDSTKLLGVSRNISMEPNNTGKRTFSVSSPPLPPVKPTSIRRRFQYNNVTGRPRVTVSSPPLSPVKPTTIRRRPPANATAKPVPTVDPNVFNTFPKSDVDTVGKQRYTGSHVLYINKKENRPCSITDSLKHFPTEESTNQDISTPPQNPPSNLTVVTVEGCSSFVILDWEMPNNDTATEFKVISTENGAPEGKNQSIITTNQTYSTVENLKPDTRYDFKVVPTNPLGEGPVSATVEFSTESADPRVSEPVPAGRDAIWTEIKFKSDSYSECRGKQYVKRTWYKKFVGIQLCNSLRYKIYLSNSLTGTFYNIGDQTGYGEDHCQFVDSFLDGSTGQQLLPEQLTTRKGFYRSVRQQPVEFGDIGGRTHISYVHWYECGIAIPGKW